MRPPKRNVFIIVAGALASVAVLTAASSCVVHAGSDAVVVSADPFDPCFDDSDCPGGTTCWVVEMDYESGIVQDSMCTRSCGSDFDCPADGICEFSGGDPPLCYLTCLGDLDCPGGFACVAEAYEPGGYPICVPY